MPTSSPMGRLPLVAGLALAVTLTVPTDQAAAQAAKGAYTVEKVAYRGWANNLKIANGDAELIVTLDVGPRVISYRLADGKNLLKEYPDQVGKSGEPDWMIRGGHRLWVGPEDHTRTYALDNGPVQYEELGPGAVRFTPAPDRTYGIQKSYDVKLAPSGSKVEVVHRLTNIGSEPTDLAVWAITVMAPGGVEIIPLPPKRPHPGSPKNARSAADFAPNQLMSVWPFLDFQDPRWHFGSKFITLTQKPDRGATKLGLAHQAGGVGYLLDGTLFVKRFAYEEGKTYPDGGVNFETFTNEDMLEIETLGPIVRLEPGQTAENTERWELFGGLGAVAGEDEIAAKIGPKLR